MAGEAEAEGPPSRGRDLLHAPRQGLGEVRGGLFALGPGTEWGLVGDGPEQGPKWTPAHLSEGATLEPEDPVYGDALLRRLGLLSSWIFSVLEAGVVIGEDVEGLLKWLGS